MEVQRTVSSGQTKSDTHTKIRWEKTHSKKGGLTCLWLWFEKNIFCIALFWFWSIKLQCRHVHEKVRIIYAFYNQEQLYEIWSVIQSSHDSSLERRYRGYDDESAGTRWSTNDGDDQTRCNGNAPGHKVSDPFLHLEIQEALFIWLKLDLRWIKCQVKADSHQQFHVLHLHDILPCVRAGYGRALSWS